MAPSGWGTGASLEELLFAKGYLFEFFQAVRLALRFHPERQPLGEFTSPSNEAVGLHTDVSFASPASVVRDISTSPPFPSVSQMDVPIHLTVSTLGLAGFSGVLPIYFTDLLVEARRRRKYELIAFLDLFNHRLLSLEYRAWEKYRVIVAFERRPRVRLAGTRFAVDLLSLMGLGIRPNLQRLEISDHALLRYSGLLLPRPRSAVGLAALLADHFAVPVKIGQFEGAWCELASTDRAYLGARTESGQLGCGAMIGRSTWYAQASFAVEIGPLSWSRFTEFLPGGRAFGEVVQFTDHFTGRQFSEFRVRLAVHQTEVPEASIPLAGTGPQLGWTTWLKGVQHKKNPSNVEFVSFNSCDSAAVMRQKVVLGLRRTAAQFEARYDTTLVWADTVIPFLMSRATSRRERVSVQDQITDVRREVEVRLRQESKAPHEVRIRVESGQLQCEFT